MLSYFRRHCVCRGDLLRPTWPPEEAGRGINRQALQLCLLHVAPMSAVAILSSGPSQLCCTVLCMPPQCCWRHTCQIVILSSGASSSGALDLRAETCLLEAPVLAVQVPGIYHAFLSAT